MSCMCLLKLKGFLASLENLPLNLLMSLLPKDLPQLSMLGGMASGMATFQAMASASASASAHLRAALKLSLPPFPLPALDLGKLEAMAFIAGKTGANAMQANASLAFQRMAVSMNVNLPSLMQLLMEMLQPIIDPLLDLLALLQSVEAVQTAFGINLAVPGAMPRLSVALAARANLALAADINLQAAINLGNYARLMRAAAALGFNLALPGMAARFSAALSLAAGLPIPPLNINLPQMNTLATLLAALQPIGKSMLGINMRLPNAFNLLSAAIAALLANLLEPINISATAMDNLTKAAKLGSQCNAVPSALGLGLQLSAMAAFKFSLPSFNLLPDLGAFAAAARFGEATGINVWSSSPCGSACPAGKLF